jgi:diaminopropionate ammonia-lyase
MTGAEIVVNTGALPRLDDVAAVKGPLDVHRKLPGYARTPLREYPALAESLGVRRLWVKDESSRMGLPAFKMLGASYAVYRVLVDRLGAEPAWERFDELVAAVAPLRPLTLTAATDGNHGRALARMARLLGLHARIYVPEGLARPRIEAIESEGAAVQVVAGDYDAAVRRSAEDAGERCLVMSDTSWPGYETVPRWVIDGYSTIFAEIDEQLGAATPDVVVLQCGVGSFAAAGVVHYKHAATGSAPRLIGVEPISAACVLESVRTGEPVTVPGPHPSIMAGLNCGTPSRVAWPVISRGLDALVAIDDGWTRAAMRELARVGLAVGETGAAGLAGAHALAKRQRLTASDEVLLICTEGPTDPDNYAAIIDGTGDSQN